MKWTEAIWQTKLQVALTAICISVIAYQNVRHDIFDILTVIILGLIGGMYVTFLYICKKVKELIGESDK